jgi:hypothetical protein
MTSFNIRNELAIFHIDNAIGDVENAIVLGDEKDCAASLFGEGLHEFYNFATRFFIESSRGFIG